METSTAGNKTASLLINALGALATFATVVIVLAAKFTEGAWITVVILILLVAFMMSVRRHYVRTLRQVAAAVPLPLHSAQPPILVVPIEAWSRVSQKALAFALSVSPDVQAVHVQSRENDDPDHGKKLLEIWRTRVEEPATKAGQHVAKLVLLSSPYRFVVQPLVDYVIALEHQNKDRTIAVVIPQLVEPRWYNYFLHNQRGQLLAALLVLKGDRRIVTINVPWYLKE